MDGSLDIDKGSYDTRGPMRHSLPLWEKNNTFVYSITDREKAYCIDDRLVVSNKRMAWFTREACD